MHQSGTVAISAIAGMGGVGKTELALKYARKHEADYPGGICWLSARESNLATKIVQFAQDKMKLEVPQKNWRDELLSLTEQVAWCWQNWQPPEGLVLLVLDDVTSLGSCREFLPKTNRFRVLMTTRLRNLDSNIEEISLNVLSPEKALQLLTAILGEKWVQKVQKELDSAKELCKWLGDLPLGLELVGRYLFDKPPHWTLAKVLEQLKKQRLEDEALNCNASSLQETLSTAQQGVLAAFELSWLELDLMTQHVAELLSLFAPDIFRWKWVESATVLLNCTSTDIDTASQQLYKRHLIQWVEDEDRDDYYKIHPLIREFLKLKLAASEQESKLKYVLAASLVAVAKKIPDSPTLESIRGAKDFIPHIAEVAQNLADVVRDEDLIGLFVGLSKFYAGQGLFAVAEIWLKRCVSVVQNRLGEEHPDVAASYNNLAELYYLQGRYSEAKHLYNQALSLRRRLLEDEHPDIAVILNNLALVYDSEGSYSKAKPLYQQALSMRWRLLGNEHLDVAESLNNLAAFYYSQKRYSKAERLYQKALELWKSLLGDEHLNVALIHSNLAALYRAQERYSEAEDSNEQALSMRRRLLRDEHPLVALSYNNLAALYLSQGRYSEAEGRYSEAKRLFKKAERLFKRAWAIRKRLLGKDHPDVAESRNNLASVYKEQGRYRRAELLYRKALEQWRHRFGELHPWFTFTRDKLASLYRLQGRDSEAELLYVKAET